MAEWDLTLSGGGAPLKHLRPGALYRLPLPKTKLEAPVPDIKGTKGYGIVELTGDTLKLAYDLEKEKRPKDFKGEKGFYFELKKEKGKGATAWSMSV